MKPAAEFLGVVVAVVTPDDLYVPILFAAVASLGGNADLPSSTWATWYGPVVVGCPAMTVACTLD